MTSQVPESEKWSQIFPTGGEECLLGTVVSHRPSDKPYVKFDYDGRTTAVSISDVPMVSEVYEKRLLLIVVMRNVNFYQKYIHSENSKICWASSTDLISSANRQRGAKTFEFEDVPVSLTLKGRKRPRDNKVNLCLAWKRRTSKLWENFEAKKCSYHYISSSLCFVHSHMILFLSLCFSHSNMIIFLHRKSLYRPSLPLDPGRVWIQ